jgi:hypothetical protein
MIPSLILTALFSTLIGMIVFSLKENTIFSVPSISIMKGRDNMVTALGSLFLIIFTLVILFAVIQLLKPTPATYPMSPVEESKFEIFSDNNNNRRTVVYRMKGKHNGKRKALAQRQTA